MEDLSQYGQSQSKREMGMNNEETKVNVGLGYTLNLGNFQSLRIDISVTEVNAENISQIKNNCYNILIEGTIFQNFKYIREGSILDSLENIQFLHDRCLLLSLDKYDYKEDSKIIYDNDQLELIVKKLKTQNKNIILSVSIV